MSVKKYIYRIERMHHLIERKATGTPKEFAKKIGLSKSQLFQIILEMKELGFPIVYDSYRQCYRYAREGIFTTLGFKEDTLSADELNSIQGGWSTFHYNDLAGSYNSRQFHAYLTA